MFQSDGEVKGACRIMGKGQPPGAAPDQHSKRWIRVCLFTPGAREPGETSGPGVSGMLWPSDCCSPAPPPHHYLSDFGVLGAERILSI